MKVFGVWMIAVDTEAQSAPSVFLSTDINEGREATYALGGSPERRTLHPANESGLARPIRGHTHLLSRGRWWHGRSS